MNQPQTIDGKFYVELLSYGEKGAVGHALQNAKEHFKEIDPIVALEIGVLRGHNAVNIHEQLNPDLLILVDPWDFCDETHDSNWMDTWYRIQGKANVFILKATSEEASLLLSPVLQFDYIYLDGDHIGGDLSKGTEDEGIRKDIKTWFPRVREGGILAGHDYNYDNIKQEVDAVFGDKVNHSPYNPNGGMEWWIYKEMNHDI